jgi:hypothetical protein
MLTVVIVTTQMASAAAPPRVTESVAADRPLRVVYESAAYDPASGNVTLTVRFDRRPNFRTFDGYGRPADAFQYFIVGDETLGYPQNFDAVIRSGERWSRSHLLTIRNSAPSDPDPVAQGWGAIRATVPFQLHGRVLTFSARLNALSDLSADGRFTYNLETYNFGSLVDSIVNESVLRFGRTAA